MNARVPIVAVLVALVSACGGGKESKATLPPLEEGTPEAQESGGEGSPAGKAEGVAGTLEARRRSTLSPRAGGVVTKVHVRDGDRVKEDDPLVSIDPEDFALRARQAQAATDAARAGFAAAESDWKRAKALVADNAVSKAQFEGADARYLGAKAAVAQAEAALAMARKAERDAVVRAPFPGVIVRRYVSEGEYASVMPATNLVTLEEVGVFDLRLYVPADQAGRVKKGDLVTLKFPDSGKEAKGKVLQVLPALDANATAAVLVEVPDPEGALRPGMTATAVLRNGT